jgi:hypothetical protein
MVLIEKSHGHLPILGSNLKKRREPWQPKILSLDCFAKWISIKDVKKHSQTSLHPSEMVTLLFALKGIGLLTRILAKPIGIRPT